MTFAVLTTQDQAAWLQTLQSCKLYDFYHLPSYHRLAEGRGEGAARLFVYREGDQVIALPLLLRSLHDLPGAKPGWQDATSVYGYAGPVASQAEIPLSMVANFGGALQEWLQRAQVVSVFSRLNAMLPQTPILTGLGENRSTRITVSIDLTLPLAVQRAAYRGSHKCVVNRLRRGGMICVHDRDGTYLDDFIRIYHETMERVGATQDYFFSRDYFVELLTNLDTEAHLFVCLHEGKAVCGGLFVECSGIVQYHLGGTLNDALKLAPMKLLVDEVRLTATARGCRVLHLGGGTSDRPDDDLLHFKRGFSRRFHDFVVWQWVLMPDAYRQLCAASSQADNSDFFPAYRCTAVGGQSASIVHGRAAGSPVADSMLRNEADRLPAPELGGTP
jgi:hypothetical protein